MGIAVGHDQSRTFVFCWTDGSENVGPLGALIMRRTRARATFCPSACNLVFLTNARFVLEPYFHWRPAILYADFCDLSGEVFLNSCCASSF